MATWPGPRRHSGAAVDGGVRRLPHLHDGGASHLRAVSDWWRHVPTSSGSSTWCSIASTPPPTGSILPLESRPCSSMPAPPSPTATRSALLHYSSLPLCPLYSQLPSLHVLYILSSPLRFIHADLDRLRLMGIIQELCPQEVQIIEFLRRARPAEV